MTSPTATHRDPTALLSTPDSIAMLLASALVASAANVIISLVLFSSEQQYLAVFSLNAAATLFAFLLLHAFVWLALQGLLKRSAPENRTAWQVAATVFFFTLGLQLPVLDFAHYNSADLVPGLLLIAVVVTVSLTSLSFFIIRRRPTEPLPLFNSSSLVAIALVAIAALLLIWVMLTQIRFRNPSGLPTPAGLIAGALFLAFLLAMWRFRLSLPNRLSPRRWLFALVMILLIAPVWLFFQEQLVAWGRTRSSSSHQARPNLVLITVDTLRADVLGATAGTDLTPNIDDLAANSVVFSKARSASPWTKPATASILTGLSPLVHGAVSPRSSLGEQFTTLAETMQQDGYMTGAIGRNSNLSHVFGFDQGFETYRMFLGSSVLTNPSLGSRLLEGFGIELTRPSTDTLAWQARRWLNLYSGSPFFLWLHFFDPHAPFAPPEMWLDDDTAAEEGFLSFDEGGEFRQGLRILSAQDRQRIKDLYAAEVRYVDHAIGTVLSLLRELGVYDNSLIVFSSDHGEEFFEHGDISHGHSLYDEVLRVPLLFKLPSGAPAGVIDVPVSTESITPTVLEVTGIGADSYPFSSASLACYWETEPDSESSPIVGSTGLLFFADRTSIVFDNWKYIRVLDSGDEELYDLDEDPGEHRSLVETHPEILQLGRNLFDAYVDSNATTRSQLVGTAPNGEAEETVPKEVLEDLKALGYLQ